MPTMRAPSMHMSTSRAATYAGEVTRGAVLFQTDAWLASSISNSPPVAADIDFSESADFVPGMVITLNLRKNRKISTRSSKIEGNAMKTLQEKNFLRRNNGRKTTSLLSCVSEPLRCSKL